MNQAIRSKSLLRDSRGATIVEYVLILSVVMLMTTPAFRLLGSKVTAAFDAATAQFAP
jgi:Flp pilus assembly pilin Flp